MQCCIVYDIYYAGGMDQENNQSGDATVCSLSSCLHGLNPKGSCKKQPLAAGSCCIIDQY